MCIHRTPPPLILAKPLVFRRNCNGDALPAASGAAQPLGDVARVAEFPLMPPFRHVNAWEGNLATVLAGDAPGIPSGTQPPAVKAGRAGGRPPLDHAKMRKAEQSNARQKKHQIKQKASDTTDREEKLMALLPIVTLYGAIDNLIPRLHKLGNRIALRELIDGCDI